MSESEREILRELIRGDPMASIVAWSLCKVPFKRKGEVFRYLLRRGIYGRFLVELSEKNGHDPFKIYKAVIDQMEGNGSKPLSIEDLQ